MDKFIFTLPATIGIFKSTLSNQRIRYSFEKEVVKKLGFDWEIEVYYTGDRIMINWWKYSVVEKEWELGGTDVFMKNDDAYTFLLNKLNEIEEKNRLRMEIK